MRDLKGFIITIFFTVIFFYLTGCIINASFNISNWYIESRIILSMLWLLLTGMQVPFYTKYTIKNRHDK